MTDNTYSKQNCWSQGLSF